jgi:membrane-associated phospholipid phosphatase
MFVAFNRVILGAHFLSDVLPGWLLTMLALAWVRRWMDARRKPKLRR